MKVYNKPVIGFYPVYRGTPNLPYGAAQFIRPHPAVAQKRHAQFAMNPVLLPTSNQKPCSARLSKILKHVDKLKRCWSASNIGANPGRDVMRP